MNVTDLKEIWQIDIGGVVYEAKFEELEEWINEGSLLRQDKVRRGRLRWIEAQKVPGLIKFFDAIAKEYAPAVAASQPNHAQISENVQTKAKNFSTANPATPFQGNTYKTESSQETSEFADSPVNFQTENNFKGERQKKQNIASENFSAPSENCCVHTERAADYFCDTCSNSFSIRIAFGKRMLFSRC